MKSISFIFLIGRITLITAAITPSFLMCHIRTPLRTDRKDITHKNAANYRKKPKNKPKPQACSDDTEEQNNDKHHGYHPNPVVLTGVSHIMNGALNIAQDPHSRPNVGHSIASIVHGIATIIIEKLARRKIALKNWHILEQCYNEACRDICNQITHIMKNEL